MKQLKGFPEGFNADWRKLIAADPQAEMVELFERCRREALEEGFIAAKKAWHQTCDCTEEFEIHEAVLKEWPLDVKEKSDG